MENDFHQKKLSTESLKQKLKMFHVSPRAITVAAIVAKSPLAKWLPLAVWLLSEEKNSCNDPNSDLRAVERQE